MSGLFGSIIVTYRCNARCNMCSVWGSPTRPEEEISPGVLEKLPRMKFCNITGGEPFIRKDIEDIVGILSAKSGRIVISTNGYFTERIIALSKKFPEAGIRISIEGLPEANDAIRGIPSGFDKGLRTLLELRQMGRKDIGFGMTVQDSNRRDIVPLYLLSRALGYEFATATLHNSHYFHKLDNKINDPDAVSAEFRKLIKLMLGSTKIKEWFRAYFNYGLVNYIKGNKRLLPCEMGEQGFFIDPHGYVLACNGMDRKDPLGNIVRQEWDDIWNGEKAKAARRAVRSCSKNCWMIGSAAPAMTSHPLVPIAWILRNKIKLFTGRDIDEF